MLGLRTWATRIGVWLQDIANKEAGDLCLGISTAAAKEKVHPGRWHVTSGGGGDGHHAGLQAGRSPNKRCSKKEENKNSSREACGSLWSSWIPLQKGLGLVQSLSRVRLSATPWTAVCQALVSLTNSCSACSNSCPSSRIHVIHPCHPLSSPSPPVLNLSQHQGIFH